MTDSTSSRIHYTKPSITEREIGYVTDAATHGWPGAAWHFPRLWPVEEATREVARWAARPYPAAP